MLVDMVRVDVLLYYIAGRYLQWQRRKREGIPSDHSLFKIANLPGHVRLPGESRVRHPSLLSHQYRT